MKAVAGALVALCVVAPARAAMPAYQGSAPVAYLADVSSGAILFSRAADKRMPPASMAKMMTAYVAFGMISRGEVRLDRKLTVRPEVWAKWHGPSAGSTMFLKAGEQVSVENLLHGIVTVSGNDACVALAEGLTGSEAAFIERMNAEARRLGLRHSQFGTVNGWPDGGKTLVTARDLATLAMATLRDHPDLYRRFYGKPSFTWGTTTGGKPITQPNRNPLLGRVEGADGIKTGHTDEAGYGFTGSAEQQGRRLVMVVAGLPSETARITESVKLMQWGFDAWQAKPLLKAQVRVGEARVQQGWSADVGLVTQRAVSFIVPKGEAAVTPKLFIAYQGPVSAPVRKGSHVADLVVRVPGMADQVTPLLAADDVSKAGFFGRLWSGLLSLL